MSEVTVKLPKYLEHHLRELADQHGVSLQQYILDLLATQSSLDYLVEPQSEEEVSYQRKQYAKLLEQLGQASFKEIESVLSESESIEPEAGLDADILQILKRRLSK